MTARADFARRLAGAIVGYIVFAATTATMFLVMSRDPHAAQSITVMTWSILVGVAAAFVGGYLAALIARTADLIAPMALAAIIGLGAIASMVFSQTDSAHWTQWAALLTMVPSAIIGGVVRARKNPSRPAAASRA